MMMAPETSTPQDDAPAPPELPQAPPEPPSPGPAPDLCAPEARWDQVRVSKVEIRNR